jgi:histone H4
MYEEMRGINFIWLENVLRDIVTFTDHARRKTVTTSDVLEALRRNGKPLYGAFDHFLR